MHWKDCTARCQIELGVQLRRATIRGVRWVCLVGDIGAAKTVAITSCFSNEGTLGV